MIFLFFAALLVPASAQDALMSAELLATQLKDPALVILHVGNQQDFQAGHIPGVRLVTLNDISVIGERNLRLEVPPIEKLQAALMKLATESPWLAFWRCSLFRLALGIERLGGQLAVRLLEQNFNLAFCLFELFLAFA